MSFKDRLAKMQSKMKEQQADYVPGGNFAPIPDGEYSFRIKATLDETKKAPARLMMTFCFVVAEGDKEGRQVWNNCILEDNKVGAQIARGIVEDLGYEWPSDDLGQLEDIAQDITDRSPIVEGVAKSKESNGYTNVNIRITNVLEMPEGTDNTGAEAEAEAEAEEASAEEAEVETASDGSDDDKTALLDFAASQGIDGFTDEHSLEEMLEALKDSGLKLEENSLSDDEKALIEKLGLSIIVEKTKPKAKAKPVVAPAKAKPVLKKGKK